MQYEIVILEMLTRIKKLEDEVELLKQRCAEDQTVNAVEDMAEEASLGEASGGTHQRVSDDMIEACYVYGKELFNDGKIRELVQKVVSETGMNRNSAIMALYAVSNMLGGTVYKRAINKKANRLYFDRIYSEYGKEGLRKAIQATRLHIAYRRECGHTVDSIEKLCDEYSRKISE